MTKPLEEIKLQDEEKTQLSLHGYSIGKPLNSGGYAVVYLSRHFEDECAAKVIDINEMRLSKRSIKLTREILSLKQAKHPNIVQVLDIFYVSCSSKLIIFMELAEGGDLFDLMNNRGFDEPTASKYYQQIGNALAYLHSIGVAHRDLKPENILLDKARQKCMITDFGAGRRVFESHTGRSIMAQTLVGTTITNAPEVLKTGLDYIDSYDPLKADVWSSGMVLFYILHCRYPYEPREETDRNVLNAQQKWTIKFGSNLSEHGRSLILRHLIFDPKLRPSMERIMTDVWFNRARR